MKLTNLIISFLFFFQSGAQDLTGTWVGSGTMTPYVKLVIIKNGNEYIGYSYDEGMGFCKANFLGTFNTAKQQLTGQGKGFIEHSITHGQTKFKLIYEENNSIHYLRGTARPKTLAATIASFGMAERVELIRMDTKVDTTVFMKANLDQGTRDIADIIHIEDSTDDVSIEPNAVFIPPDVILEARQHRLVDTISRISTSEQLITLSIYDNGQVDGDTITVFHNNEILISNHFVSATPFKISIEAGPGKKVHKILLVAHNLGSIPPNTAILIVEAGEKRYRLSASADLSKNALLLIEYHE